MFETLFKYPRVIARHRTGPSAEARERFLKRIDGPRLFRHEGLPVGPPWPDVQRLIASASGDATRDIRDRAILILLATYGLRSGEVAGLCLEDLN